MQAAAQKIISSPSGYSRDSSTKTKVLSKHQPPLVMSPVNDDEIQGSQDPKDVISASGPKIPAESLKTQFKMMKRAVAKCPEVNITIMGDSMPFLLASSSMVSIMQQTYFNRYFRPHLGPAKGAMAEAHNSFDLKVPMFGTYPSLGMLKLTLNF